MNEARVCAAGIGLTEGPLWAAGGRLLVTSISRGRVYEVFLDGREPVAVLETGGGPTGLAQTHDGRIWIANGNRTEEALPGDGPRIQVWDGASETAETAVDSGITPNDIELGPDGWLWFTNPTGHPFEPDTAGGALRRLDPHTLTVETLTDGLLFPNGLAFGPDPDEVYVAETAARRVVRMTRTSDGWSSPEAFAHLDEGHPDGIAFDADRRLHVAATQADAVMVFDRSGALCERIDLGASFPTSCAFAGPDGATLVVTAARGGRVFAVDRSTPGLIHTMRS